MASIDDIVSNIKNSNSNLSALVQAIKSIFPQFTATSTTATAGTATLPATPQLFLTVTLPDGSSGKIPVYNT